MAFDKTIYFHPVCIFMFKCYRFHDINLYIPCLFIFSNTFSGNRAQNYWPNIKLLNSKIKRDGTTINHATTHFLNL